ncbi:hypothetical protein [Phenylobacterium sp.]|uniref:hypothetical protein n=1 Tax=Phenylobacterium sp. TaxID=1871053 RepID=UPI00391D9AA0
MSTHNIIASEALDDPRDRLVHFCHVHGSIRMYPRPRRLPLALLAFAGGAAAAAIATWALARIVFG